MPMQANDMTMMGTTFEGAGRLLIIILDWAEAMGAELSAPNTLYIPRWLGKTV